MAKKNLTVRIDEKELSKIRKVAKYECRSVNRQILILIRDCVEEFAKEHDQTDINRF